MKQKFSLFLLERTFRGHEDLSDSCFIYLDTYDTLEEAESAQKETNLKTIIIGTYGT